jgi:hypothetical protein
MAVYTKKEECCVKVAEYDLIMSQVEFKKHQLEYTEKLHALYKRHGAELRTFFDEMCNGETEAVRNVGDLTHKTYHAQDTPRTPDSHTLTHTHVFVYQILKTES